MDNNLDCCIVIPVYRQLTVYEYLSFQRLVHIFGKSEYQNNIYIVTHQGISTHEFRNIYNKIQVIYIDEQYFKNGIVGYNKLIGSSSFYNIFINYKYILIHQLDCFVFYNNLKYFIDLDYDYYGAPIFNVVEKDKQGNIKFKFPKVMVGNGGFSLRKVKTFYDFCKQNGDQIDHNEDVFFCYFHKEHFNICPINIAKEFAFDCFPNKVFEEVKKLPMASHGYQKMGIQWLDKIMNTNWI